MDDIRMWLYVVGVCTLAAFLMIRFSIKVDREVQQWFETTGRVGR